MADTVAYLMEEMIPELEDFERRGLFTRAEIKRVVAARREHEYRLKRRAALKEDFLRAIEVRARVGGEQGRWRRSARNEGRARGLCGGG
jgi:U3 small nucleolar RNA-associated protein 6